MHCRFLEISLPSADLLASMDFYRLLGFTELATNDAHEHPYAVVSDGRASIGLHGREAAGPELSFVSPGLAEAVAAGVPAGINPVSTRLGDDDFHRARFLDADGHSLTLLEARTFSPPAATDALDSLLGYFEGVALPCIDLEAGARRWEALGFVALGDEVDAATSVTLTSDAVNLILKTAPQPREPALLFSGSDIGTRVETLKQRGIDLLQEIPGEHGVQLRTPEGLLLCLFDSV